MDLKQSDKEKNKELGADSWARERLASNELTGMSCAQDRVTTG